MHTFNGFYQISVPIPVPLKEVNCYLTQSPAGWHIIDTGFHTEEAKSTWKDAFRLLNIAPQDVVEIVVTHYHPDHFGLAGWLQEYTGAPVKTSSSSKRIIKDLWIDKKEAELFSQLAYEHGMKTDVRNKVVNFLTRFPRHVSPFPEFTTFEEGERFAWSDEYVAIHTPGHAEGHMIFFSSNSNTVLAGDLLLPKITPNVGYFPGLDPNPLKSFFDSMLKIQQFNLDTVLSGHRSVYKNGNERAMELISHHQKRLQEICLYLQNPSTVQEISEKLFPFLSMDSDPLQLLFALQESLAHLIYLKEEGIINGEASRAGIVRFSLEKSMMNI